MADGWLGSRASSSRIQVRRTLDPGLPCLVSFLWDVCPPVNRLSVRYEWPWAVCSGLICACAERHWRSCVGRDFGCLSVAYCACANRLDCSRDAHPVCVFTIGVIASPLPIWLLGLEQPGATPVLLYPHRSHPCPLARLAGSDPLLQDTNRAPCLCVTFPRVPFHKIHGTK